MKRSSLSTRIAVSDFGIAGIALHLSSLLDQGATVVGLLGWCFGIRGLVYLLWREEP